MDIPLQTIVFSIPSLAVVAFHKSRSATWRDALSKVGWRGAGVRYLAAGLVLRLLPGVFLSGLMQLLPTQAMNDPNLANSQYQGWLLHRSGSILPGWLSHSLGNAFGALLFMG